MYISVIILPLVSAILVGFFGRFFGKKGGCVLANFFLWICCVLSWGLFYEVILSGTKVNIVLWNWLYIGSLQVQWSFLFDSVTCVMLVVITSISSLVHLYSVNYMLYDPHIIRFMSYLSLFTFFMIILVTSGNFLQLFMGWEGVGVSSYLLINFWFTRIAANQSAIKAIIVNRFGDIGILISLLVMFEITSSFDFGVVFSLLPLINENVITVGTYDINVLTLISFGLFIGAVGKSAQIGLHTWLPDAMEGPTPVSALIHAATMVTAGVFVLIRVSPILSYAESILVFITIIGAITGFFAGCVGIFQNDLKRVIAYSTCSQLGYMIMCCGLSNYTIALFHLMNHAFFKALLFLSAGAVIHAIGDEQDMRKMGGLLHVLPFTYSSFVIGSCALLGFPFTTGYYSKELILELAFSNNSKVGFFAYLLLLCGAGCTAFYSIRLLFFTFFSETNINKKNFKNLHEGSIEMVIPMLLLGFGSIFVGYIFKDIFLGIGNNVFRESIINGLFNNRLNIMEAELLKTYVKVLPIIVSIVIVISTNFLYQKYAYLLYNVNNITFNNNILLDIYRFFNKKWYFDKVFNIFFVLPVLNFGNKITFKMLDRGIIEIFGPTGIVRAVILFENFFKIQMSGYIFKYVFIMSISVCLIIGLVKYNLILVKLDVLLVILFVYLSVFDFKKFELDEKE